MFFVLEGKRYFDHMARMFPTCSGTIAIWVTWKKCSSCVGKGNVLGQKPRSTPLVLREKCTFGEIGERLCTGWEVTVHSAHERYIAGMHLQIRCDPVMFFSCLK